VYILRPSFLSKFDASGNLGWTRQLESALFEGVSADGLGNVYISGAISPFASISKYDAEGTLEWARLGNDVGVSESISADGLGNVYGGNYMSVVKYNDCPDCEPPAIPPVVADVTLAGEIFPGSLVTHQFTTSLGDPPITSGNLAPTRQTVNPPTLSESGLFSWQTSKLDGPGLYHFEVAATNEGGSDTGRLTLRLAIIPEPSALLLLSLGICASLIALRARC
jgi:hypothetical protein